VKFTSFDKMRETEKFEDIEALTKLLITVSKTTRKININVVHKSGTRIYMS
jgi:hypothetical protein